MKVAVITTRFLEDYVRYALQRLRPRCETELFIYRDFEHVGNLYLELEDKFDGFLVSGPVPRQAVLKRAGNLKKPVDSFGSDAQCYYEVFFRVLYEQKDPGLTNGYFDLLEWVDSPQPLASYLAAGTFGRLLDQIYESTMLRSLAEIESLEKKILEKHLSLWQDSKILYSVTRLSSLMPALQDAGVRVYFVYPHLELIRDALDRLVREIDLRRMQGNQLSIIRVSLRNAALPENERGARYDALERVLSAYSREQCARFIVQRGGDAINLFSQVREVRRITNEFSTCSLRPYLQKHCGFPVCVGYGLSSDVSHAMTNALDANREACADPQGASYLRDESNDPVPLKENSAEAPANSYVRETAKKTHVSVKTMQRLFDFLATIPDGKVTSQTLAAALGITVRSANRLLGSLVSCGNAQMLYEVQSNAKGRPERVYQLLLSPAKET